MIGINDRLNDIVKKYNIDRQTQRFGQSLKAMRLLNELVNKYNDAYFIASSETDIMRLKQDVKHSGRLDCIVVDIDKKDSFDNINCAGKNVILISYYWKNEISSKLFEKGIEHISLYDYFILNGLYIEHDYYNIFGGAYHRFDTGFKTGDFYQYSPYEDIANDRKLVENILDDNLKKIYYERLIFKLFYIRDFITAKKYIDAYILICDYDAIDYKSAWDEVMALFDEIREELANRSQKDAVIFIIDTLEHGEDRFMPFMKKLSANSLVFENAYTVTPFTEFTLVSMFLGLKAVDDMSFKAKKITNENCDWLRNLKSKGIDFKYYGINYDIDTHEIESNVVAHITNPAPQLYWNAVNDILNCASPVLYMIHSYYESHCPFISADIDGNYYSGSYTQIDVVAQAEASIRYVDKQLEFYSALLPDSMAKVYMSDHGKSKYGKYHTTFKVQSPEIPAKTESRLFSLLNFNKFVQYLMEPSDLNYDALFSEIADIQNINYCYPLTVAKGMNPKPGGFKPEFFIGYRGVVTEHDVYLRHDHGAEYFHKHKNDGILFSAERAEYLRSLIDGKTSEIDMENEEKFRYAKYSNKIIERYNARNCEYEKRKTELLKKLFESFDDNLNIAIYTGRETSFKLLLRIGLDLCKKVDYIIDVEPGCIAGKLGIPVIDPSRIDKYPIDVIVKTKYASTSNRFGITLYLEKENPELGQASCQIIDIYDYLEENGIKCTREFWMLEFEEADFDIDFPFLEVYEKVFGAKLF